jgi:hypothetical protein
MFFHGYPPPHNLMNLGFNVIKEAMIDHPARGGQLRFIARCDEALHD